VIATTYTLGTPDSPVVFEGIIHEQPDATREEIFNLWELFAEHLDVWRSKTGKNTGIHWLTSTSAEASNCCDDGWDTVGGSPDIPLRWVYPHHTYIYPWTWGCNAIVAGRPFPIFGTSKVSPEPSTTRKQHMMMERRNSSTGPRGEQQRLRSYR